MANTFKFGNGNWAVKDGYALAYNDENNNFKPLPFDFTRASSATRVNKQGLVETVPRGKPRIDFTDNTSGHLLLEPSRTNSIPYSNLFTYSGWSKVGAGTGSTPTVTGDYAISPDGSQNASRLQLDKGSGTTLSDYSFLYETVTSVGTGSISIWMKSNDSNTYQVALRMVNYTVCDVTPEWQRFELNNQSSTNEIQIMLRGTFGTSDNADILIYGAQLEAGSYTTSYIPTEGSSVTRAKDDIDNENTDVLTLSNSASFYWNVKGQAEGNDGNNTGHAIRFRTNPSSGSNSYFGLNSNVTDWRIRLQDGSSSNFKSLSISKFNDVKVVVIINTSTYSIYANGAAIYTNQSYSGTAPTIEKIMRVQSDMASDNRGVIKVVDLKAYNTELTATEAINLTS